MTLGALLLMYGQRTTLRVHAQPGNDAFASAVVISSLPFTASLSTIGATVEASEPSPCVSIGATAWYRFTPSVTQFVQADTIGSDFDTALAMYTGASLGSLSTVACDDDSGPGQTSRVTFTATAGITYHFQVGGFAALTGGAVFNLTSFTTPPNDAFANASVIGALPFTASLSTLGATNQQTELAPCGGIDATVWYRFTPSVTQLVEADTIGSTYDTVLAVNMGASLGSLSTVACNDNVGPALTSRITFTANAGTTYHFQVGGFFGETGNLVFSVREIVPATPPPPVGGVSVFPDPEAVPLETAEPPARFGRSFLLGTGAAAATLAVVAWYARRRLTSRAPNDAERLP